MGTIVLILALGSLIEGLNTGNSANSWLIVSGILTITLLGSLVAPAVYMVRFGAKNVFKWVLVHLGIIVVSLLVFAALTAVHTPSEDNYNNCGPLDICAKG